MITEQHILKPTDTSNYRFSKQFFNLYSCFKVPMFLQQNFAKNVNQKAMRESFLSSCLESLLFKTSKIKGNKWNPNISAFSLWKPFCLEKDFCHKSNNNFLKAEKHLIWVFKRSYWVDLTWTSLWEEMTPSSPNPFSELQRNNQNNLIFWRKTKK